MFSRLLSITTILVTSATVADADDKDIVARLFHTESKYIVMNLPPRPDAWPGAIFTSNLRLPIAHGDAKDPAIRKGPSVAIDSNSGFDLNAKLNTGISLFFNASAKAEDTANVVMSFPDARINEMDLGELQKRVMASKEAVDAAKRGQIPLVVIRSYSGTPTITITRKAGTSADAWAKIKQDVKISGGAEANSDDKISYKAGENFVFAFETAQVEFDPDSLVNGVYKIKLSSLPNTLFAFREDESQLQIAKTISASTGISLDDIRSKGILGGENTLFRKALKIPW